jgi:hypothetical protein
LGLQASLVRKAVLSWPHGNSNAQADAHFLVYWNGKFLCRLQSYGDRVPNLLRELSCVFSAIYFYCQTVSIDERDRVLTLKDLVLKRASPNAVMVRTNAINREWPSGGGKPQCRFAIIAMLWIDRRQPPQCDGNSSPTANAT